ncbi:glycosyltransferase family 4 protein [Candidatus Erwinia haradaeae]|uniref:Glycosyl transferase group 1 family protein n=1 Tax=Candidatus Erwinia haradaeae TaxID=1922217 RepID=A0A451D7N6_9GAMM|nr:glycosyltransferase family 4 protein [Candidatus Erwinia haradaeae]VFP81842.1 Glycosyl transferase group 1 family protein [Candidatus Erwinia haradaeae]
MKNIHLAIVRQQHRFDGGAEHFITSMLEASGLKKLNLHIIARQWPKKYLTHSTFHPCNPIKLGRISRERGFAKAARTLWKREHFNLIQSHERISGCHIYRAGDGIHQIWLEQRCRTLPKWRQKILLSSQYHNYIMEAENKMYQAPELRAVICNTQMIKKEIIERFGLTSNKIHVIYNSINTKRFIPANEQEKINIRKQLHLPLQARILIYVGSGFERKGLAYAIHAVAMTHYYLIVIGRDKKEEKYKKIANELGCTNRILFVGIQHNMCQWYQASDGLILPSLYDPGPNVILEAMACGLPIITSTTCGGKEFVQSGKTGYICDALNIPSIRDAIMNLPPSTYDSHISNYIRKKTISLSSDQLTQKLISLYQTVMD